MHTTLESGTGIPAFLAKLWKMVEDPKTNDLISWSPSGKSFIIRNQARFASDLLPHYYKHNNLASFIRQLNMYGFHKKVSIELGGLKCEKNDMEFAHHYFCKGQAYLMEHIKRKIAPNKNQDSLHSPVKSEVMGKMLAEVRHMWNRQEDMDSKLDAMKLENATLWRELAMLRQKHAKQQQIVNKLIHFLITIVQHPSRGNLPKRRYPLMLDSSNCSPRKEAKLSKSQASPMGPVIHELDASELDMDSDYIPTEILKNEIPTVQSPEGHIETLIDVEDMKTVHLIENSVKNPKIDTKKKRVCKGKKKRKNKMPVRILIPPYTNGEKPREDLLEVSIDEDEPVAIALLKNESMNAKPVPMASLRSSKLTAMAANIKSQDIEHDTDIDTPVDLEDDMEGLDNDISKPEELIPYMLNNSIIQNNDENTEDDNSNRMNKRLNQIDEDKSILVTNNNEQQNESSMVKSLKKNNNSDKASASSSKDLSVSCVNSFGMSDANYRLEPTDELDNHLGATQSNLENFRIEFDKMFGDTGSINTFLELFGSKEDAMEFVLPINPELNSNCKREDDDDNIISDSNNGAGGGGELMTYNPNLFDDEFLGNAASSSDLTNSLYTSDSLNMETDSKEFLLDSLENNANPKL